MPGDRQSFSKETWNNIIEWRIALIDAIDNSEHEIDASNWGSDRDEEQTLSHADIRAWCIKWGHAWPIPSPNPLPAHDAECLQRLRFAEAERERLQKENTKLNKAIRDANTLLVDKREISTATDTQTLITQVEQLTAECHSTRRENQQLRALIPPLPNDLLTIIFAVQREFWIEWSKDTPRPKSEVIVGWIKENFPKQVPSDFLAATIDKIACPINRDPSAKSSLRAGNITP